MTNQDELRLGDYLRVIIKNKQLIVWGTLLCILVAGIVSFLLPRVYQTQLILEIGKLYQIPDRGRSIQSVELIEGKRTVAEILKSKSMLYQIREELDLAIPLQKMRRNLEINIFREEREVSTLIEVIYRGNPNQSTVEVLDSLASKVIAGHSKKYRGAVKSLQNRIKILEERIYVIQRVIDQEKSYQSQIIRQSAQIAQKISDFEDKVANMDIETLSNVEAIFLDSAARYQQSILVSLNNALASSIKSIGDNQVKIGNYQVEIADLHNLVNLCQETRVRGQIVMPEKPIRPKITVNIAIGGMVGLALTLGTVFLKEHY